MQPKEARQKFELKMKALALSEKIKLSSEFIRIAGNNFVYYQKLIEQGYAGRIKTKTKRNNKIKR